MGCPWLVPAPSRCQQVGLRELGRPGSVLRLTYLFLGRKMSKYIASWHPSLLSRLAVDETRAGSKQTKKPEVAQGCNEALNLLLLQQYADKLPCTVNVHFFSARLSLGRNTVFVSPNCTVNRQEPAKWHMRFVKCISTVLNDGS